MQGDRTVLRTDINDHNNVTWSQKSNRFGWESYLGMDCCAKNTPAYSVLARHDNLSGLAQAWIGVGSLDIFHDEEMAYAHRMNETGVECDIKVIPGALHGFDAINHQLPVIQAFRNMQIEVLKRYLFN